MEEEHKYQREMEKRELERKAQVRKGHNSLKEKGVISPNRDLCSLLKFGT